MYHELCIQLEDARFEISRLDHFNADVQKTLGSVFQKEGSLRCCKRFSFVLCFTHLNAHPFFLIFTESEQSFKNQVLRLSRQKDEHSEEISNLKEEIKYPNEDFVAMEKDAAKVAKLTRKNAQDAKVRLFNDFCNSRGIPRVPLDLEVFSDDEPADDKRASTHKDSDGEDTETYEDFEAGDPKGKAPLITKASDIAYFFVESSGSASWHW